MRFCSGRISSPQLHNKGWNMLLQCLKCHPQMPQMSGSHLRSHCSSHLSHGALTVQPASSASLPPSAGGSTMTSAPPRWSPASRRRNAYSFWYVPAAAVSHWWTILILKLTVCALNRNMAHRIWTNTLSCVCRWEKKQYLCIFKKDTLHLHLPLHFGFVFKFSLQGSHHVECPFKAGESKGGSKGFITLGYFTWAVGVLNISLSPHSLQTCRHGRCAWFPAGRVCFCTSHLLFQQHSLHSCVFTRREHVYPRVRSTLPPW